MFKDHSAEVRIKKPRICFPFLSVKKNNNQSFLYLFSILFLGAFLRFYGLDSKDLWLNEVLAIYRFEEVRTAYDPHPPLYYALLKLWMQNFGKTEFAIRSLSVLTSIGSIFILNKISEMLLDRTSALITAVILAASPFHIWYAQEARNHSLSVFLVLTSVFVLLLCLRRDKRHLWIIFCIMTSLAIYADYFVFFMIIAEGILFSIKEWRPLFKKWLISIFFSFVFFLPCLLTMIKQILFIKGGFWIYKPTLKSIIISFENFNIGYHATTWMYILSWFFFVFFIIGFIDLYYRKNKELFLLLCFLTVPVIGSFVISQIKPIYLDGRLMICSPFYYMIIGQGLAKLKGHFLKICSVGVMLFLAAFSLRNYYLDEISAPYIHHQGICAKGAFKPIAKYLKMNYQDGDIIAHAHRGTIEPMKFYYLDENPAIHYYFLFPETLIPYWKNVFYDYVRHGDTNAVDLSQESAKEYAGQFKRIWLITSSWERNGITDENSKKVKKWMDNKFLKAAEEEVAGVWITLYKSK